MIIKKTITALILALGVLISNVYGQMPGNMSPPDFNPEKATGIFEYDIEKVIKKIKNH
jgi:hypothetical protein